MVVLVVDDGDSGDGDGGSDDGRNDGSDDGGDDGDCCYGDEHDV